jgi:hypothetical protein
VATKKQDAEQAPPVTEPVAVADGATHLATLGCGCTLREAVPVATRHHCPDHGAAVVVGRTELRERG